MAQLKSKKSRRVSAGGASVPDGGPGHGAPLPRRLPDHRAATRTFHRALRIQISSLPAPHQNRDRVKGRLISVFLKTLLDCGLKRKKYRHVTVDRYRNYCTNNDVIF